MSCVVVIGVDAVSGERARLQANTKFYDLVKIIIFRRLEDMKTIPFKLDFAVSPHSNEKSLIR